MGVVDVGDHCAGEPATDLAGGLLTLPFDALPDFLDAYGPVDQPTYGPIGTPTIENTLEPVPAC